MTTSSPKLPASLILKLDKRSLEEIEGYVSDRKVDALFDTISTLSPDEVAHALNRLNRAYLDGDFDKSSTDVDDDD